MVVRTRDRIEIDWSDSGRYDHPDSDVTRHYKEYSIDFGMRASYDRDTFDNISADGAVILDNESKKYSIESALGLPVPILSSRHLCRITSIIEGFPDNILWEGFVLPVREERAITGQEAIFEVQGKLADPYRDHITISSDDSTRTVSWWLDSQFDAIGSVYVNSVNPPTGRVIWPMPQSAITNAQYNALSEEEKDNFQGYTREEIVAYLPSRHDFIEALADFTGAFAFEDNLGLLQFHDYQLMDDLEPIANFDTDLHRFDPVDTKLHRHYGIVRNAVTIFAYDEGRRVLEERVGLKDREKRVQRCPPWATPRTKDLIKEWLFFRSAPMQYADMAVYRRQSDEGKQYNVERLRPGSSFTATLLDVDDFDADGKFFVIGTKIEKRFDAEPMIYLRAIATALQEPPGFVFGQSRMGRGKLGDGT